MRTSLLDRLAVIALCLLVCGACTSSKVATPAPTHQAEAEPTAQPTTTTEPKAAITPLSVFCAGSLIIPFAAIENAFEDAHPNIDVLVETHGSIQCVRHVTDLHEAIDVVAPADQALISMLMYNTPNPDTQQPYGSWLIRFAGNRLSLAYGEHSPGADELTTDNWPEIITRPGTRIGLSDPRFDACGYRGLMALQLAEEHYQYKTLLEDVLMGRFMQPIRAVPEGNAVRIHVPEILEPRPRSTIVLRGSSIQLIPLLQSGDVDYVFEYESVAHQHGLEYIPLPDSVNLGNPELAESYRRVSVQLDYQRFFAVEPLFYGEPIKYGITIPSSAPHPEEAALFIQFLLSPTGRAIMAENDHPLSTPITADHPDALPPALQSLGLSE